MLNQTTSRFSNSVENFQFLNQLYKLQLVYVKKKRIHFSIVYIKYSQEASVSYEEFIQVLKSQLRSSDFAFAHKSENFVILLLAISKVNETKALLGRIQTKLQPFNMPLVSVIAEIANSLHALEEVLGIMEETVMRLEFHHSQSIVLSNFLEKESVIVKVSIIDNDLITQSIFSNLFHNIETEHRELEIRKFNDGQDFIESDWYQSSHSHIVVLNDILPRKNGFEVLHYLRGLPNEQKYLIVFISTRNSEDSQLYSFENGADAYFVRPFNLKIFEIQMKNYLSRPRK
ncbi:response regulator [Solibacillus sp. A46]|uniref:Response regulator n=1 Tax=Solibacillus faecavium TaxID=2762221 RepID=A0ABR8XTS5_9BACL|nr:response regulator [Solibacillus faecavium]MBD8035333.1 response regulator [Solibacillus faecavium]